MLDETRISLVSKQTLPKGQQFLRGRLQICRTGESRRYSLWAQQVQYFLKGHADEAHAQVHL
jgi:hypothetical protein